MLSRVAFLPAFASLLLLFGGSRASASSAPIFVYFPHGSAELDRGSRAVIRCAAEIMVGHGLYVSAYADPSGPADYNLKLSHRQAMAVRAELIRLGFQPEHVKAEGFGELRLAIETPDEVRDQRNRYAWLHIHSYVGPVTNSGRGCRSPAYQEASQAAFRTVYPKAGPR
jgi:hypothetical protein